MLSLDGEGAPEYPCPAWAPSHPGELPAVPRALCVWVAVSWGKSHMLRPWTCSKTKTSSKIWIFPIAQLLLEQVSVSSGGGPYSMGLLAILGMCSLGASGGVQPWDAQDALAHRNY